MKHLIKTFFFGYLPLGGKRLFRVATFSWVVFVIVELRIDGLNDFDEEFIFLTILGIGVSMILSYVISGFIKQKQTKLTTREKGKKFLDELRKKGPLNDKLGQTFVKTKFTDNKKTP